MDVPSIDAKNEILSLALNRGFARARIISPFAPDLRSATPGWAGCAGPSALVVALSYGNPPPGASLPPADLRQPLQIDHFSRRNYYAEAVQRLQTISGDIRRRWGGKKNQYRVLCNSPIPEKPIALACGLGVQGRNTLVITPEAGSLIVIAILSLPFRLLGDRPLEVNPCAGCMACVRACPTGALPGDGSLDRTKCLQWYLSRPVEVPPDIAERWGTRLYGCSVCREVCPHNANHFDGTGTDLGNLPEWFEADEISMASDEELIRRFRGTALGMGWLGPEAIRRNARLGARTYEKCAKGKG